MFKGLTETTVAAEQRKRRVDCSKQKLKHKGLKAMLTFVKDQAGWNVENVSGCRAGFGAVQV